MDDYDERLMRRERRALQIRDWVSLMAHLSKLIGPLLLVVLLAAYAYFLFWG